ncbi:MAG: response regulator transcription factor [Ignavibacteriota bacterium]
MEKFQRFAQPGPRKPDSRPVSVLIVDDHPVVRGRPLRDDFGGFRYSGSGRGGTGAEALAAIQQLRPMVVLMDLLLPDIDGWEVIKQVCASSSDTAFLVLTTLVGDEEIYRALEAGARGYLFKDMARKELVNAIRAVASGKRYIPAEVGARIAEGLPRTALTTREIEVLQGIALGLRNKEIAHQLGVSESTVNAHVKHILEKLHATDRTQAVTTALRRGIIRL